MTIETPLKLKIACTGIQGSGRVAAYNVISIEHLTLTGCASAKLGTCASSGAAAGEVRADPVSAVLGLGEKKKGLFVPALQWQPASGEELAHMTCGAHAVVISGSFIALTGKKWAMLTTEKLLAKEKKGVPTIAGLSKAPPAALSIQVDGEPVQAAAAKMTALETNEEAIEIR